jgi:quercetin dioxygenase-like cupin family protein
MRISARAAVVTASAALLAVTIVAGPADATPGNGATSKLISQNTVDGKDYIIRQITLAPGGSTGWHHHNGTLYALVKEGTLTHTANTCKRDGLYTKGDMFIEPSGADHVHIGRNLGNTPVVLDVLYVDPAGSPLAVSDPNPGCPGIE